jgi:hypothetical protein
MGSGGIAPTFLILSLNGSGQLLAWAVSPPRWGESPCCQLDRRRGGRPMGVVRTNKQNMVTFTISRPYNILSCYNTNTDQIEILRGKMIISLREFWCIQNFGWKLLRWMLTRKQMWACEHPSKIHREIECVVCIDSGGSGSTAVGSYEHDTIIWTAERFP